MQQIVHHFFLDLIILESALQNYQIIPPPRLSEFEYSIIFSLYLQDSSHYFLFWTNELINYVFS